MSNQLDLSVTWTEKYLSGRCQSQKCCAAEEVLGSWEQGAPWWAVHYVLPAAVPRCSCLQFSQLHPSSYTQKAMTIYFSSSSSPFHTLAKILRPLALTLSHSLEPLTDSWWSPPAFLTFNSVKKHDFLSSICWQLLRLPACLLFEFFLSSSVVLQFPS